MPHNVRQPRTYIVHNAKCWKAAGDFKVGQSSAQMVLTRHLTKTCDTLTGTTSAAVIDKLIQHGLHAAKLQHPFSSLQVIFAFGMKQTVVSLSLTTTRESKGADLQVRFRAQVSIA